MYQSTCCEKCDVDKLMPMTIKNNDFNDTFALMMWRFIHDSIYNYAMEL